MQRMNTYFYPNLVEVQCNPDPTVTARRTTMYQRKLKIYKGVTNTVQFLFRNSDEKPVNVTGWVITFNMISREEASLIVSKTATVVNAVGGLVTIILDSLDLIGLDNSYYNYSLTVTDPNGVEQVVYVDENYEVAGQILLQDGPYPEFRPSIIADLPSNSNNSVYTSAITADTPNRQQSAHHTAQFFFSNFTGNLTVQGTLDSIAPVGNVATNISWATISTLQYTNQNVTGYLNFDGVFTAVRFIVQPTTGNVSPCPVTQILYRA